MRFLLTNDDGIDAPGLQALSQAVRGHQVIVAPDAPLSGCSHQVTTDRPIRIQQQAENWYSVSGTPADCVRVALFKLSPQVDWVLSGINAGGNLGADIFISGTVAAVREAALQGVPAVAFSHYRRANLAYDWNRASRWARQILEELVTHPVKPGSFWNVNFPHLHPDAPEPTPIFCPLCTQPLPIDYAIEGEWFRYQGRYSDRPRNRGADTDVCLSGGISVSLIQL
jgi:5'-nucleotidase